jgi:predicted DNA-binding helix-hairpin-helix protein
MSLKKVAPEKDFKSVYTPMNYLKEKIAGYKQERQHSQKAPLFAPSGQSTQLVIGATPENDLHVLHLADDLYKQQKLRRVYYSGYVPISDDSRLPALKSPPLVRENRLYQSDWLLRFYGFQVDEIVNEQHPDLDLDVDPKFSYALRNPQFFPIDVNTAPLEMILRIPGVGMKSAHKIVEARQFGRLREEHLKKMRVVWKRAKYFLTCDGQNTQFLGFYPDIIRQQVLHGEQKIKNAGQLSLFDVPPKPTLLIEN